MRFKSIWAYSHIQAHAKLQWLNRICEKESCYLLTWCNFLEAGETSYQQDRHKTQVTGYQLPHGDCGTDALAGPLEEEEVTGYLSWDENMLTAEIMASVAHSMFTSSFHLGGFFQSL